MSDLLVLSFLLGITALAIIIVRTLRTKRADRGALAKFLADHDDRRPQLHVVAEHTTTDATEPPPRSVSLQRQVAIGAGMMAAAIGAGAALTAGDSSPDASGGDRAAPGPVSRTGQVSHAARTMSSLTTSATRQQQPSPAPTRTATAGPQPTTSASTPTTTSSASSAIPPTEATTPLNRPSQHRGHMRQLQKRSGLGKYAGLIGSVVGLIVN